MLDNVYFSLEDTARSWFENYEATLTSSAMFQQEGQRAISGDHHKEKAEDILRTRIPQPSETVTRDVLRLLGRADLNATEERKIHSLIRGVKEEIFNAIIRDPPSTVDDFVTIATRIERAASSRIRHRQLLPESNSLENPQFSTGVDDPLKQAIRDIVREELWKLHPQSVTTSTSSFIGDIIREKVSKPWELPLLFDQVRGLL